MPHLDHSIWRLRLESALPLLSLGLEQGSATTNLSALGSFLWLLNGSVDTLGPTWPNHAPPPVHHLFSHSSASVAPTLGHSAPYMPFSTSRMFCKVLNLAGSVS